MRSSAVPAARSDHDLWGCFTRHFVSEVARTQSQRRDAYRLRYRIYCEERRYEDPTRFPDRCEIDSYDRQAVQMLVRGRASGAPIGVTRLILPKWSDSCHRFPLEGVCGYPAFGRSFEDRARSREDVAEVSRFAVARTVLDSGMRPGRPSGEEEPDPRHARPADGLVALGLIALLFAVSADHGIKVWYAMMEKALARRLSRVGIDFRAIGPAVEHRGTRSPMTARVDDLRASISTRNPAFSALIDGVRDAVVAGDVRAHTQQPRLHRLGVF